MAIERLKRTLSSLTRRARRPIPFIVLALSMGATVGTWHLLDSGFQERANALYEKKTADIISTLFMRLQDHEQVLLGAAGLINVKNDTTRDEWRRYVASLRMEEHHPGVLGIGFSVWLTPLEKQNLVQQLRSEGFHDFNVSPDGERPQYTSIVFLEPFNWRNQRAFGYDMLTEPKRYAAMSMARDTGQTTIAPKITLMQETEKDKQAGFLMYVPVYKKGMPVDTVDHRRAAIKGFVYSPVRIKDFVTATLGEIPSDICIEVHVGAGMDNASLAYSSVQSGSLSLPVNYTPKIKSARTLHTFGTDWTLAFYTLPPFEREFHAMQSYAALGSGLAVSFLLTLIAQMLLTSREEARRELERVTREQHTILQNAGVGIVFLKDRKPIWANHKLAELMGYSHSEFMSRPTLDWYPTIEVYEQIGSEAYRTLSTGGVYTADVRLKRRSGEEFWGRLTGQAVDREHPQAGSIWIVEDITQSRALAETLEQARKERLVQVEAMAVTDSLTGLYNRRKFYEILDREIERAGRYNRPFSLLMLDIDHFKSINDTHGHLVGDAILRRLAVELKSQVRHIDEIVRWGGEEFVIILPETEVSGAASIAERIRDVIASQDMGSVGSMTISIGVAQFEPNDTADTLVKRADDALYRAKQGGRNRVEQAGDTK